jgi:CO dehydrogenase/acetyl-CoA synthase delta subunit
MNEKSVVSKYLEYRENVLKYTNIDMNLELENDEQVLKSMQLVDDYSYDESSNVRAYLKTGTPNNK